MTKDKSDFNKTGLRTTIFKEVPRGLCWVQAPGSSHPPWSLFERTKEKRGTQTSRCDGLQYPRTWRKPARGRHPFRQATTPAIRTRKGKTEAARHSAPTPAAEAQKPAAAQRRSPKQHERAQRQLRGSAAKSSKCNGEHSGSSTAAQRKSRSATAGAAAAPRQRGEKPEVQRREQRQLHGSAAKISKCNGENSGSSTAAQRNSRSATARSSCRRRTERKRTRKGQKPKGGSAVSRTKQSKRQHKARRQHSQRGKQKRSEK